MHAFILIAHGSKRQASNDEIITLTKKLSPRLKQSFNLVHTAFLELATPNIEQAIQTCVEQGATRITTFPYFLTAGQHVAYDVPQQIEATLKKHPHIQSNQLEYFGASPHLCQLIETLLLT